MEFNRYVLREGKPGDRQRKILEKLQGREIVSTRYVDEDCLYTLGLYHSFFHLDNILGLHDTFTRKEPTFERLTREFLSSLIYLVHPDTASTVSTVKFRQFNVEYEYSTDELAALLGIPHGDGAICETPLDSEWSTDAFSFWRQLSNSSINSFEGILASLIHNPAIRIF